MKANLNIGVIAQKNKQSDELCQLLEEHGVNIFFRLLPDDILESHKITKSINVWILSIEDDDWNDRVDELIERSSIPVFFNEPGDLEQHTHVNYWCEKLIQKLSMMAESAVPVKPKHPPIQGQSVKPTPAAGVEKTPLSVWVLGASLGGPAAVKRFIHALPKDLDVGFVLAQHIDHGFLASLSKILDNEEGFSTVLIEGSHRIQHGEVIITPIEHRLVFTPAGIIGPSNEAWSSAYSPCISDVIIDVANAFEHSGTIIFTGMGDDAVVGCRHAKALNKQVWCQSADSCDNSTMPDEVRAAGLSDYSGDPEQLALHLTQHLQRQKLLAT